MEPREIRAMLHYPDTPLVDFAVSRANLTVPEWECIKLREREAETIESAAERLLVSPRTAARRYNDGMHKLNACWSGLPWVKNIIKQ